MYNICYVVRFLFVISLKNAKHHWNWAHCTRNSRVHLIVAVDWTKKKTRCHYGFSHIYIFFLLAGAYVLTTATLFWLNFSRNSTNWQRDLWPTTLNFFFIDKLYECRLCCVQLLRSHHNIELLESNRRFLFAEIDYGRLLWFRFQQVHRSNVRQWGWCFRYADRGSVSITISTAIRRHSCQISVWAHLYLIFVYRLYNVTTKATHISNSKTNKKKSLEKMYQLSFMSTFQFNINQSNMNHWPFFITYFPTDNCKTNMYFLRLSRSIVCFPIKWSKQKRKKKKKTTKSHLPGSLELSRFRF